jgi:hypothetical protein
MLGEVQCPRPGVVQGAPRGACLRRDGYPYLRTSVLHSPPPLQLPPSSHSKFIMGNECHRCGPKIRYPKRDEFVLVGVTRTQPSGRDSVQSRAKAAEREPGRQEPRFPGMPFAECAECSRPAGGAAGECVTLHRCELKTRIAPLCCDCTYSGIRKHSVKKATPENWQWIRNACRRCIRMPLRRTPCHAARSPPAGDCNLHA